MELSWEHGLISTLTGGLDARGTAAAEADKEEAILNHNSWALALGPWQQQACRPSPADTAAMSCLSYLNGLPQA